MLYTITFYYQALVFFVIKKINGFITTSLLLTPLTDLKRLTLYQEICQRKCIKVNLHLDAESTVK